MKVPNTNYLTISSPIATFQWNLCLSMQQGVGLHFNGFPLGCCDQRRLSNGKRQRGPLINGELV